MSQWQLTIKAKRTRDTLVKAGLFVIFSPFIGLFFGYKYAQKGARKFSRAKWERHNQKRVKNRRLPKSEPLARGATSSTRPTSTTTPASFLGLPVELRLEIYRLAVGNPRIAQMTQYRAYWGRRPKHWRPNQHIRDDDDPSSLVLRRTIGLGGSGLQQLVAPPQRGCVVHGLRMELICGNGGITRGCLEERWAMHTFDLMRTCRVMYDEALDILYGHHTISLFGWEIARYFCRNASPEGLQRVRFVHFALMISSSSWDSPSQQKNVQDTIRLLRDSLSSLQQLDIEVVLLWNQPKNPERFWMWLKNDVLGQFRGLGQFVLKVVVYKPLANPYPYSYETGTPECEDLENWVEGEYQDLKRKLTSKEAGSS